MSATKLPEAEARRDAMVDAETLRAFEPNDPRWQSIDSGVHRAIEIMQTSGRDSWPVSARLHAIAAARAAFRAVPALRGEA